MSKRCLALLLVWKRYHDFDDDEENGEEDSNDDGDDIDGVNCLG